MEKCPFCGSRDTDFFFTRKVLQSEAAQAICDLLRSRLPKYLGFPKEEWQAQATRCIQVLTPTKKGDCGAANLNRLLQETLNPERPGVDSLLHGETEYRVGDKVIQTKNDYQIEYTRQTPFGPEEGAGVFNGDVGYIEHIDPAEHMMTVLFDDDRAVTYQKQQLDALDLAYCLTVHKSQGSEFPVVSCRGGRAAHADGPEPALYRPDPRPAAGRTGRAGRSDSPDGGKRSRGQALHHLEGSASGRGADGAGSLNAIFKTEGKGP